MLKILIVDDHPVFRYGLRQIITKHLGDVVVDEADNGQEAVKKVLQSGCDYNVVLLDMTLPIIDGLDVLKQLKREKPELPILMLSMHLEEHYALRVLRAGASGYLTKDKAPDELMVAIRMVLSGKKYVSPSLVQELATGLGINGLKRPYELLSDREYQVLCLIVAGKAPKDIAKALSLSVQTVSTYQSRVLKKMGIKSRAELIRYGVQNQLVN